MHIIGYLNVLPSRIQRKKICIYVFTSCLDFIEILSRLKKHFSKTLPLLDTIFPPKFSPISTVDCKQLAFVVCKGVSGLEICMNYFVLNDILPRKIQQPLKKLCRREKTKTSNFHILLLKVQNNSYTFLNLRHI